MPWTGRTMLVQIPLFACIHASVGSADGGERHGRGVVLRVQTAGPAESQLVGDKDEVEPFLGGVSRVACDER